jgi:hypothetical protein
VWTVVSDDGATLRVARTTGAWTYVRDGDASCLPVSVDPAAGPDSVAGCAVPAPRPVRARRRRCPGERAAATADPVLRALGHDPAAARTAAGELAASSSTRSWRACRRRGTARPSGRRRARYPVGARMARRRPRWRDLPARDGAVRVRRHDGRYRAEPAIGCAEPGSAGGTRPVPAVPDLGCGPRELTITGARLGLASRQDAGGPVLVPAWLFDVAGSDAPIVHLAVAPEYLQSAPTTGRTSGRTVTPPTGSDGGPRRGWRRGRPRAEPGVHPSR